MRIITNATRTGMEASAVKINKWKEKATTRTKEIKRLQKRIKEVAQSRDSWKQKALLYKSQICALTHSDPQARPAFRDKPPRSHSYSASLIAFIVLIRVTTGTGLRSCCKIVSTLFIYLELQIRVPSANSVNNWCKKLGLYYHLQHQHQAHEQAGKWVVLIDESVSIGQNRLLIIAGVKQPPGSAAKQSLKLCDLHLFYIAAAKSWKGPQIAQALDKVINKDSIDYVVADKGNNILNALGSRQIEHVADCTHALAQIVEHIYAADEEFHAYTSHLGRLRKQWIISQHAALMPPQQRTKSRFLNLRQLSGYGIKILEHASRLRTEHEQAWPELEKVVAFKPFIEEMQLICRLTDKVLKYLKTKGLNKLLCQKLIQRLCSSRVEGRFSRFCDKLKEYLLYLLEKSADREWIYCCSDVIESWFGKYKSLCSNQPAAGITDSVLSMAVVGKQPDPELVKQALSQIKMKDLQEWKRENTAETLQAIRNRIFKNGGKKYG